MHAYFGSFAISQPACLLGTRTTQHAHALHTQTHGTSLPNPNLTPRSVDRGFRTAPLIRLVGPDDGLLSLTHDGPRVYLNIEDYLYYNQRWGCAGWLQLSGTLLSCQLYYCCAAQPLQLSPCAGCANMQQARSFQPGGGPAAQTLHNAIHTPRGRPNARFRAIMATLTGDARCTARRVGARMWLHPGPADT